MSQAQFMFMRKSLVSIILPTFNERGNIKKLIFSLLKMGKKEEINLEIIVVDDNSPDGTAKVVEKLSKKFPVKLIIRKRNPGLAASIKRGINESSSKTIVIMDTDFNHKPSDVPRLLKTLERENADLVIGSRYIKGGGMVLAEASKLQFIFSKLFNVFVRFLLGIPVHESLSGFLALRKSIFAPLSKKKIFQGYGDYCMRLVFFAHRERYKICEVPVVYGKRKWGVSKTRLFRHSLNYLLTALELRLKGN